MVTSLPRRSAITGPYSQAQSTNVELTLKKKKSVQRIESWAGQSDLTIGMTLSQNHGTGGPGGSGYPSFEVNRRFLRKRAAKVTETTTTKAVASAGLELLAMIAMQDDGMSSEVQQVHQTPQLETSLESRPVVQMTAGISIAHLIWEMPTELATLLGDRLGMLRKPCAAIVRLDRPIVWAGVKYGLRSGRRIYNFSPRRILPKMIRQVRMFTFSVSL